MAHSEFRINLFCDDFYGTAQAICFCMRHLDNTLNDKCLAPHYKAKKLAIIMKISACCPKNYAFPAFNLDKRSDGAIYITVFPSFVAKNNFSSASFDK
jgi:hypothetical protein